MKIDPHGKTQSLLVQGLLIAGATLFFLAAASAQVPPGNYTYVAGENGTANFSVPADLAYGAQGKYFYLYAQTGNVTFSNTTFGGDPDFGVGKSGYYSSYTQCAGEGGSATFTVPVEAAYGAQGKYFYKRGVSGTVTFNPSTFGGDPDFGVVKAGYYMAYAQCAGEGGSATFSSPTDVAYGANGRYYFLYGVTGTIAFNPTTFGGDPDFGVVKAGYYRPSGPTPIAGVYSIQSTGDNGTALQGTLDAYYNGSSYGSGIYEVATTPYNNGWSYQQWTVTPIGNGQYHIINKAENLSLQATGDPYNNGHGIVGGANKVALTPNYWNISQQVWTFNAGAGYALASPANSQNLQASQDSYKGSSSNYQVLGAPYAWGVGSAQEWNLVAVGGGANSIYSVAASSIPAPTGNGVMTFQVMNGTGGAYADNQIYWGVIGQNSANQWCYLDLNGNLIPLTAALNNASGHLVKNGVNYANIYHTISQQQWVNLPQMIGARMYLSVGTPCYITTYDNGFAGPDVNNPADPNLNVYFDWVEFSVDGAGYHGNSTRVDMFGFPIQHRVVNKAGNFDQTTGEPESETRSGIFTEYQNEVPSQFTSLAAVESPYRIVAPIHGSFATGGANANYFSSYVSGISTQDILKGVGGAAQNTVCAAINRHVYYSGNWNDPSQYYNAAPANYYSKFWHDHGINHLAYGFCYDDVNNQSSYLTIGDPKGLLIRVGW